MSVTSIKGDSNISINPNDINPANKTLLNAEWYVKLNLLRLTRY